MNKILILMALLTPLGACSQTEQGTVVGGLGGAAIGSAVAGRHNRAEGALVGGAIGAVAGNLIGRAADNQDGCRYRDRRGRIYIAECPRDYDDRDYRRHRRDRYYDDQY